jgi:hypothetical protein
VVIEENKNIIMNRIIFLFIVSSVLAVLASAYAQPILNTSLYAVISDDSLMSDGHFGNNILTPADDCPVKVKYATGTTSAVKHVTLTVTTCGVTSSSDQLQSGPVKKDEILNLGSEISTGCDGKIELELGDGSVIRMAPNTTIKITQEHCVSWSIIQKTGAIWSKVKRLLGGGKFEVTTERACACVRGTEFTVEATEKSSGVTVYEGSVEVTQLGSSGKFKNETKEVEKLAQDFQNGKISMEEFGKKMEEYSKKIEESAANMNKPVMVDAGYMITLADVVKGPEPFEKKSSNWFDDANYK